MEIYIGHQSNTKALTDSRLAALIDIGFPAEQYDDLPAAAAAAATPVEAALAGPASRIEMVKSVFFRGKGAYLIGCAFPVHQGSCLAFGLALLHEENGISVDAVLSGEDDIAILFSFTRSYFRVDAESPHELVRILKGLMPRKRLGELYTAIRYHKHGKTEFYRDFLHHLQVSEDRFEAAEGARGMVMTVLTLPSYNVVFKVIKDRFDYPKDSSRREVMSKYRLVFEHDRAGRLVEAYEFEHLRIEQNRFRPELLEELQIAQHRVRRRRLGEGDPRRNQRDLLQPRPMLLCGFTAIRREKDFRQSRRRRGRKGQKH